MIFMQRCSLLGCSPPLKALKIYQEGKEQALYFDAHVLDAQRRRHDMRGCRCRFLVRYDHDQSEVCGCFGVSLCIDKVHMFSISLDYFPGVRC